MAHPTGGNPSLRCRARCKLPGAVHRSTHTCRQPFLKVWSLVGHTTSTPPLKHKASLTEHLQLSLLVRATFLRFAHHFGIVRLFSRCCQFITTNRSRPEGSQCSSRACPTKHICSDCNSTVAASTCFRRHLGSPDRSLWQRGTCSRMNALRFERGAHRS